jgi:hypothetical protein
MLPNFWIIDQAPAIATTAIDSDAPIGVSVAI